MSEEIQKLIGDQLSVWPLAAANFRALKTVSRKKMRVFSLPAVVQFNPSRVASSTADPDIPNQNCFLCEDGRPKEQFHLPFDGRKERKYHIQVNPYPIFQNHLVIARGEHVPQSIWHNFVDMMDFARENPEYLVYYNGPRAGASAPEHMHFQAIPQNSLPLQKAIDKWLDAGKAEPLTVQQDASLFRYDRYCRGIYALRADTPKSLAKLFYRLVDCAPLDPKGSEPLLNLYVYTYGSEFRCFVALRRALRSHHYADGVSCITCGSAEMGGVFVAPFEADFQTATTGLLEAILDEVAIGAEEQDMVNWRLNRTQPKIDVKVLWGKTISFEMISDGAGPQRICLSEDGKRIMYGGVAYDELYFDSVTKSTNFAEPSFILHTEFGAFKYAGSVKFFVEAGDIVASNHVGIENYLLSYLSRKSVPDSFEQLKALTVSLRTELLGAAPELVPAYVGLTYDVNPRVRAALDLTWGKTLSDND